MRLFFSITSGKLTVCDLDEAPAEKRSLHAFSIDEADALVEYIASQLRLGWDGRAMSSSSWNWAQENGWPNNDPEDFLRPAIRRAASIVAAEVRSDGRPEPRAESGTMQFGDDWPGTFLRGDYAGPASFHLRMLIDLVKAIRTDSDAAMKLAMFADSAQFQVIVGLADTLAASDVSVGKPGAVLRPYAACMLLPKEEG